MIFGTPAVCIEIKSNVTLVESCGIIDLQFISGGFRAKACHLLALGTIIYKGKATLT